MEGDGWTQTETVLTADHILGPYTVVNPRICSLGMSAGDFDPVIDPVTKKAYYYFERVHSETICADRRLPSYNCLSYEQLLGIRALRKAGKTDEIREELAKHELSHIANTYLAEYI